MRIALASLVLVCCTPTLARYGEVIVVVDTDVDAAFTGRLRIDVYSEDGSKWLTSRDFARLDPRDWPASFSLYNPSDTPRTTLVRLRVYPEGKTRPYRGERFVPRASKDDDPKALPDDPIPADPVPRLLDASNADVTPADEPQPLLAIDRLVLVRLEPDTLRRGSVTLRGACFGTMADLANQSSCIGTEAIRAPAAQLVLESELAIPSPIAKTFGAAVECKADVRSNAAMLDEEVCVDGAGFIFGNTENFGNLIDAPMTTELHYGNGLPEHLAVLSPFRIDKWEVTVARWREAVGRGFTSPYDPKVNDSDIDPALDPASGSPKICTYSSAPRGREDFPLNCIDVDGARAFCQFLDGDLPTEAQWEYVAQKLDRERKTRWPMGEEQPTCQSAIFARGTGLFSTCISLGKGPRPENDPSADVGPRGIMNLAGSMYEWTRDAFHAFDTNCWASASIIEPQCFDPTAPYRAQRGGSWSGSFTTLYSGRHVGVYPGPSGAQGFRCVRPVR